MRTNGIKIAFSLLIATQAGAITPNDPLFSEQFALRNLGPIHYTVLGCMEQPEPGVDIGVSLAWNITTGNRNILVAIIDSGIDYTHPDLADNMWRNEGEMGVDKNGHDKSSNGIDDDLNGYIDDVRGWNFLDNSNDSRDDSGHGTGVAGVIGAVGNNGIGMAGVAWQVSLFGIKVFDRDRFTSATNLAKAVHYAVAMGASIINLSIQSSVYSSEVHEELKKASKQGVLIITAAGNSGRDNDITPTYPASYNVENLIAVTAANLSGRMMAGMNYGKNSVDIIAPGSCIVSPHPGGGFRLNDWTSFAAPLVSGIAVLVKSAFPNISAAQVKNRILGSVDVLPIYADKVGTSGRVNAVKALTNDPMARPSR